MVKIILSFGSFTSSSQRTRLCFKQGRVQGKKGFDKALREEAKNNPDGSADHQGLKHSNLKSQGYRNYAKQRDQLIKLNPKYKRYLTMLKKKPRINIKGSRILNLQRRLIFSLLIIPLFFQSCKQKVNKLTVKVKQGRFTSTSPEVEIIDSGSSKQLRFIGVDKLVLRRTVNLIQAENSYYEQRLNSEFNTNTIDTIKNIFLTKVDTSFLFLLAERTNYPMWPSGFDDWYYYVKRIAPDYYVLIKINHRNHSISEEYFYDDKYSIKKIKLNYKEDKLVLGDI